MGMTFMLAICQVFPQRMFLKRTIHAHDFYHKTASRKELILTPIL